MNREFQIVFSFTVNNGTDGLATRLDFTGDNTISLEGGTPIQIQSDRSATPALVDLRVVKNRMSVTAAPSGDWQSVTITVPFNAVSSTLHGNRRFLEADVKATYQIIGFTKNPIDIPVGAFTITFPG